ncbi:hypothetical protein EVAR_51015_1 [Eumeta japonica]|uniref:Uncharacterized protein n=1 Tax=Eumeta variegata TaxID=151549 RepID=A0A4C1Y4A9_EUMVA|nr:hypothetical protein EVAR_51015_1 [Eumeta japonica]
MDTDSERPGTSGTGRQSCLISDLAMILDSSSDDESQKTPEINNTDIRIRIRIRGCEPLKIRIRIRIRRCGKKWIRNIPSLNFRMTFRYQLGLSITNLSAGTIDKADRTILTLN